MIDEDRTMQLYGYTSNELSKGSNKKIVRVCDECKKEDFVYFNNYNRSKKPNVCKSCGQKSIKVKLVCKMCNNTFMVIPFYKDRKFCSNDCYIKYLSISKNNPMYGRDRSGKNAPMKDKHHSEESKKLMSESRKGKCCGEDNPMYGKIGTMRDKKFSDDHKRAIGNAQRGNKHWNWKGGVTGRRNHILSETQCIKLNKRFLNSHFHHLSRSIGIYIPKELHKHIMPHSLISGIGMMEMNALALQYLYSKL